MSIFAKMNDFSTAEMEAQLNKSKNYLNSIINSRDFGAIAGSAEYACSAIQATLDAALQVGIDAGNNYYCPQVAIPAGVYKMKRGIKHCPAVKVVPIGNVLFDFTDLYEGEDPEILGGTAWRVNNELWTPTEQSASPIINGVLLGDFIDGSHGSIAFVGAAGIENSRGIDIGSENSVSDWRCMRNTGMSHVNIDGFGTNLVLRSVSTYLMNFESVHSNNPYIAHLEIDGSVVAVNAGENNKFNNCLFGRAQTKDTVGILLKAPGVNLTFNGLSCDFVDKALLYIKKRVPEDDDDNQTQDVGYQQITFNDCWGETSMESALVYSDLDTDPVNLLVSVNNFHTVPKYQDLDNFQGNARPLFKGKFDLAADGIYVGGYADYALSPNGLWMVDDDVNVKKFENLSFSGRAQLPAKALVLNRDWNFDASGNTGDELNYGSPVCGLTLEIKDSFSIELSDTITFDGSANSLKATCSSDNKYFATQSESFPLEKLKTAKTSAVIYGGTSTGDIRVQYEIKALRYYTPADANITRIDRTYAVGVAATDINHGMDVGDIFKIQNSDIEVLNGQYVVRGVTDTSKAPVVITSITRSGNTATAMTAEPHGLSAYETIEMSDWDQAEYNGVKGLKAVTPDTFTFTVDPAAVTPATGAGSYSMVAGFNYLLASTSGTSLFTESAANTLIIDPYKTVLTTAQVGSDFGDIYDRATDPDHDAGNRTMWAKEKEHIQFKNDLPNGVTHFRVRTVFSRWLNGDVVYIGALPILTI